MASNINPDIITAAPVSKDAMKTQLGIARDEITVLQASVAVLAPESILALSVDSFGAVGNGITNDRLAIQAAIDSAFAAGGGIVRLGAKAYLASGGALVVRDKVHLVGADSSIGETYFINDPSKRTDYTIARKIPYSLYVDGDTFSLRSNASVSGINIIRAGITFPVDYTAAVAEVNAWTGTGIRFGGTVFNEANDSVVENCFFLGFAFGIVSVNNERVLIKNVKGDATNGIWIDGSSDIPRVQNCHLWPFYTGHLGNLAFTLTVTNAVSGTAGVVRLTTSVANSIQTGDIVHVFGVGGVTLGGTNGARFLATKISASVIELQGSSFGGLYTSGGTVQQNAASLRTGIAYRIESVVGSSIDGAWLSDIFCYGYDIGLQIGNGANDTKVLNFGCDNLFTSNDLLRVGINITGTAIRSVITSPIISSAGRPVVVNAPSLEAHSIYGGLIAGPTNAPYAIQMLAGVLVATNCVLGPASAYIFDAASNLHLFGCDVRAGLTIDGQSTAARQKAILVGNRTANSEITARLRGGAVGLGTLNALLGTYNDYLTIDGDGLIVIGPQNIEATLPSVRMRPRKSVGTIGDVGYFSMNMQDSAGTETAGYRMRLEASVVTPGAASAIVNLESFVGGTLTGALRLLPTSIASLRPHQLASYTIGTLPSATSIPGALVHLTDGAGGKRLAIADAGIWLYADGTTV